MFLEHGGSNDGTRQLAMELVELRCHNRASPERARSDCSLGRAPDASDGVAVDECEFPVGAETIRPAARPTLPRVHVAFDKQSLGLEDAVGEAIASRRIVGWECIVGAAVERDHLRRPQIEREPDAIDSLQIHIGIVGRIGRARVEWAAEHIRVDRLRDEHRDMRQIGAFRIAGNNTERVAEDARQLGADPLRSRHFGLGRRGGGSGWSIGADRAGSGQRVGVINCRITGRSQG